jgi:hypothetical protein
MRFSGFILLLTLALQAGARDGAAIYKEHCASCHGDKGQGVADEYDEALVGKKSIASLTRYIHKSMPEDDEDAVIDDDARAVSEYMFHAFYSPEAQAKLNPVRKDLLRRTQHQHRRALSDLVASFRGNSNLGDKQGLFARYFNKEKMNNQKGKLAERTDTWIGFDLKSDHKIKNLNPKAFSINWSGSIMPPETGSYGFRISTPNGARLWLNDIDNNTDPLIDAWVSSNNKMRQVEKSAFLLGGHSISIYLDYVSYKENVSSIQFEWKPPHGTWQPIPQRYLFPKRSQVLAIPTTPFPADDASMGYERGSSISKAWREAVTNSAIEITNHVFEDLDRLSRSKSDDKDRAQKLRDFCATMAERAFARPLSAEQRKIHVDGIFDRSKDDLDSAVKRSLLLTLTSPYFLYPDLNRNVEGKPDQYTLASKLALTLWDSLPDKPLLDAARNGHLAKENQINPRIDKMLNDPRTKEKLHRFFFTWLNLAEKDDLSKDLETFPGFDENVIADLRTSLTLFIEQVVWSEKSDYRQLFLSGELPVNQRLAMFYGTEAPKWGFANVPANKHRAGLFTHPYILSAFSYHKQTSPIHRGVYLSRNVLGRFLKPPPNAIEFKDADFKPNLTMREKVTEITKDNSCMSCHSIINPVGFGLEHYDAVGRFRTHEKKKPINSTSDYPTEDDKTVRITGAPDLAKLAVESPGAHRAFIKHLFHHLVQQPTNSFGFTTMDGLHEDFTKNNFNIRHLVKTIAKTNAIN